MLIVASSSRATEFLDRDAFAQVLNAIAIQVDVHFIGRPFEAIRLLFLLGDAKEKPSGLSENIDL